MGVKIAVIVSDTHCGSHTGLLPEGVEGFEGHEFRLNEFQKWLLECWNHLHEEAIPKIVQGDPWVGIVNGDMIDGDHHKTKEIVSREIGDHIAIAEKSFERFAEMSEKLFIVEGTDSHTGTVEHAIGCRLGAEKDPLGRGAWKELPIEIHGCYGVVRHHITATSRPYLEGSQFSINIGVEIMEAARHGDKIPKWFARAHRHRHGKYEDGHSLMVITGGWQGRSRWLRNRMPAAVPMPSAWVLDWRGVPEGALPVTHPITYVPKPASRHIVTV